MSLLYPGGTSAKRVEQHLLHRLVAGHTQKAQMNSKDSSDAEEKGVGIWGSPGKNPAGDPFWFTLKTFKYL